MEAFPPMMIQPRSPQPEAPDTPPQVAGPRAPPSPTSESPPALDRQPSASIEPFPSLPGHGLEQTVQLQVPSTPLSRCLALPFPTSC